MKANPALTRIDPVFGFNPKIVFKMLFHAGPKNETEGVYGKYMVYLGRGSIVSGLMDVSDANNQFALSLCGVAKW